jgi:exostosin family protein
VHVYVARLASEPAQDLPAAEFEQVAALDRVGKHELTDDPASADVILFTQCHMLPKDWRLHAIRKHPLTSRFPEKVMVYDQRYRPWCAFPGVYTSMPTRQFAPRFQRAWGYWPFPAEETSSEPDLLFSFIGTISHRCRRPLLELRHPDAILERVRRFNAYDPSSVDFEARRERFQSILARSRFVLCPRGIATSSMRLYETLSAGRVPVIISDAWVAPAGPGWDRFSIRWPERKTTGLVELLEERNGDWAAMSAAARAAHEAWFAPERWFHGLMEQCRELQSAHAARLPRGGRRDMAFIAAGAEVARWQITTPIRRAVRHTLRRLHLDRTPPRS